MKDFLKSIGVGAIVVVPLLGIIILLDSVSEKTEALIALICFTVAFILVVGVACYSIGEFIRNGWNN